MIKNIFLNCAQLLDRDDLYDEIKISNTIDDIKEKHIQSDVLKLISYYNFITNLIYENYVELVREDDFISNSDKKIYFNGFLFRPVKVISVKSTSHDEYFQIFSDYIIVLKSNARYKVRYRYIPDNVRDLNDEIYFKGIVSDQIICEGIVSQFLASKARFNESEYWHDKFMSDLFKLKCKKDRRLKLNYKI